MILIYFSAKREGHLQKVQKAGYDCDATMLDHFIAIVKAFQKHREKKNGEFGKITENTGSNHWSTINDNRVS